MILGIASAPAGRWLFALIRRLRLSQLLKQARLSSGAAVLLPKLLTPSSQSGRNVLRTDLLVPFRKVGELGDVLAAELLQKTQGERC